MLAAIKLQFKKAKETANMFGLYFQGLIESLLLLKRLTRATAMESCERDVVQECFGAIEGTQPERFFQIPPCLLVIHEDKVSLGNANEAIEGLLNRREYDALEVFMRLRVLP